MSRRIESHWDVTVEPCLLEQYRASRNWQAILRSVIEKMDLVEGILWERASFIDIGTPGSITPAQLVILASLLNIVRLPGESDEELYNRLLAATTARNGGTPEGVIYVASKVSGDESPQFLDESPATFFVYTPEGSQLRAGTLQEFAPAGVLGLVGAAIETADGAIIRAVDDPNPIILAVADDNVTQGRTMDRESGGPIFMESGYLVLQE